MWLQAATECGCQSIDECTLFDDPRSPAAKDTRPGDYARRRCVTGRSIALFVVAAVAESGGAYLMWQAVEGGPRPLFALAGAAAWPGTGQSRRFNPTPTSAAYWRRRVHPRPCDHRVTLGPDIALAEVEAVSRRWAAAGG